MLREAANELLKLAKNILETPLSKISEIPQLKEYIKAIDVAFPPEINQRVDVGLNTKIAKKKAIYSIAIGNMEFYSINIWIIYETFCIYLEIDVPGILRQVLAQTYSLHMSSGSYCSLFDDTQYDLDELGDKTIPELLKSLCMK
jgi:hypothetical protein